MRRYFDIALVGIVALGIVLSVVIYRLNQETPTTVALDGAGDPVFRLSGSARLKAFRVSDAAMTTNATDPLDNSRILREFEPLDSGAFLSDLHSIEYGTVPNGYFQSTPIRKNPPRLRRNHPNLYWLETWNAPAMGRLFQLDNNGQPVLTTAEVRC